MLNSGIHPIGIELLSSSASRFLALASLKGKRDGADGGGHCSCHLTCCRLLNISRTPGSLPSALCQFSFSFLYSCSRNATSMIICSSRVYTVVGKTSSWYCLLHLLYSKDTDALPTLQAQTPTAPPPSSPSQVVASCFRIQSDALDRNKLSFQIFLLLRGRKKKRKRRRRMQANVESPNPRG